MNESCCLRCSGFTYSLDCFTKEVRNDRIHTNLLHSRSPSDKSFPVDRRGIFLSICPPNHQFFKCGIIKIDDDKSSNRQGYYAQNKKKETNHDEQANVRITIILRNSGQRNFRWELIRLVWRLHHHKRERQNPSGWAGDRSSSFTRHPGKDQWPGTGYPLCHENRPLNVIRSKWSLKC